MASIGEATIIRPPTNDQDAAENSLFVVIAVFFHLAETGGQDQVDQNAGQESKYRPTQLI